MARPLASLQPAPAGDEYFEYSDLFREDLRIFASPYRRQAQDRSRKLKHFLLGRWEPGWNSTIPFASRLPTGTKVESGTSQSKSGTSVNLSNSGNRARRRKGPHNRQHKSTSSLMSFAEQIVVQIVCDEKCAAVPRRAGI